MGILKIAGKWLSRRFPGAFDLLLSPRFGRMRRTVTSHIPALTETIAGIYFFRGADDLARQELLAGHRSLRNGTIAARIHEMDMVLDGSLVSVSDHVTAEATPRDELNTARVVHALDNSLMASSSGYAQRSHVLLKALVMAGFRPIALTRPGYPRQRPARADGSGARQIIDGIEYCSIEPGSNVYERMPETAYISYYACELIRAAQKCGAPVIHAHSNYLNGLAAAWAARQSGRASVYEVRGVWHLTRAALDPAFAATKLFAYQARMELKAMSQVDHVIVPSAAMREWLIGEGIHAERISLVPYSANLATITPLAKNTELAKRLGLGGKFILGFVGSVTVYEGLDIVLKAMAACAGRGLDVALVIVGEGPALLGLKQLARRLGIAERLITVGRKPMPEVSDYYSIFDLCPIVRSDVAVCRIVSPLKPAEIMAAGKSMIVSALPPLMDYGEEGKSRVSVPPDDPYRLADCIIGLSHNPELLTSLGSRARQWAERNLNDREVGNRYAATYRELLTDRNIGAPTGGTS